MGAAADLIELIPSWHFISLIALIEHKDEREDQH